MNTSFRVLTFTGALILAASGCGKGSKSADARAPKKNEVAHSTKSMKAVNSDARAVAVRPAGKTGTLTAEDNGRDLDLRQGQVVTVMLDSNKSSGLGWVVVEPNGPAIVTQGSPAYASHAGKRNTPGTETWHFRAAKPGHQTVRMEYRRKWAQSVPERTFRFNGTVR